MRNFIVGMVVLTWSTGAIASGADFSDFNRIGNRTIVDRYGRNATADQAKDFETESSPADVNAVVKQMREEFWRLYPDKPGIQEAAAKFDYALLLKDAQIIRRMMARQLVGGVVNNAPAAWAPRMAPAVPTKDYDGGVPPIATGAFGEWSAAVLGPLPQDPLQLTVQSRRELITRGLRNGESDLLAYLEARDYAEFHRAGRPGEFFPTGGSLVFFAFLINTRSVELPPNDSKRLADSLAWLLQTYGEEAVENAGELLRGSKLSATLVPTNYQELGIPRTEVSPRDAILFVLNRDAPPKAFAIGALRTRGQYVFDALFDGQSRYRAMVAAHGEAEVHRVAAEVQKQPLDLTTGRISDGPMAGSTWAQALMIRLPLKEDPGEINVADRRARVRAERDAELRAMAEAREAKQRERDKELSAEGRIASEAQYKQLRDAYALGREIDARTQGYTDLAGDVLKVAGYWDMHAKNPTIESAGAAAWEIVKTLSRRKPKPEGERFAELLGFTRNHAVSYAGYLVPLEQVQARWIKEGKIKPDDALDLSATPSRTRLQAEIDRAQSILDGSLKRLETSKTAKDDAEFVRQVKLQERWVEHRKQMLDHYLRHGPYRLFEVDEDGPTGYEALDAFLLLREVASSYEPIWLGQLNATRADAGLKPIKSDPLMAVAAEAAAGLWNEYVLTGDKRHLNAMWTAMLEATARDQAGNFFYSDIKARFRLPASLEQLPPPPAPVQQLRVANGQMDPSDAFDFRTPIEVPSLLLELRTKQNQLANGRGDLQAKFDELDRIIEKIAELDRSIGREPRLASYASRVDHNAAAVAEAPKPVPTPTPRPTTPQPKPESDVADPGEAEYAAWVEALKIADKADADALAATNEERKALGLDPIAAFTETRDWVQLAAGYWDRYARSGEPGDYNAMRQALSKLPRDNGDATAKIKDTVKFVYDSVNDLSKQTRTPLGDVQAKRADETELMPADRLTLEASDERLQLLDDLYDEAEDLRRRELWWGKQMQKPQRESYIERNEADLAERRAKVEALRRALTELDKKSEP